MLCKAVPQRWHLFMQQPLLLLQTIMLIKCYCSACAQVLKVSEVLIIITITRQHMMCTTLPLPTSSLLETASVHCQSQQCL